MAERLLMPLESREHRVGAQVILAAYYWSGIVSTADLDLLAAYLQGFAPSLPWSPAL